MLSTRDVAQRALGDVLKRQPNSPAKIRLAWQSSVGESMSRATTVSLDPSGVLQVAADTEHWRREVARSVPVIRKRLVQMLGPGTVKRVTVKRR